MKENLGPLVQLKSGERLVRHEERVDGVVTDAGIIPWSDVEGVWSWCQWMGRYMFVPQ
jgi:hypothetical protein